MSEQYNVIGQIFGVFFMLLPMALAINYFKKRAHRRKKWNSSD